MKNCLSITIALPLENEEYACSELLSAGGCSITSGIGSLAIYSLSCDSSLPLKKSRCSPLPGNFWSSFELFLLSIFFREEASVARCTTVDNWDKHAVNSSVESSWRARSWITQYEGIYTICIIHKITISLHTCHIHDPFGKTLRCFTVR